MTQHAVPRVTRRRRWLRGLWPDRNPLRRTADRVEAAVVAGLLAAFVIGAPLAALIAGHWSYAVPLRAEHAQRAAWRGTRRSGGVSVPGRARAGSTVLVWVDASGGLAGPPLRHAQVIGQVTTAALLTPVGLGLLLVCAGVVARGRLERRRIATWDADWQVTGPQWTRRH